MTSLQRKFATSHFVMCSMKRSAQSARYAHQKDILIRSVYKVVHIEEGKEVCASFEAARAHTNSLHSTAALL